MRRATRPTLLRRVSPIRSMSGFAPVSALVADFEADTRMRFSRGQNLSLTKLLKAVDDAAELCDHVGLTIIRSRLTETLELLAPGKFHQLLEQLLLEVKNAERMAIQKLRPAKKSTEERNELLAKARRALQEDTEEQAARPALEEVSF